MSTVHAIPTLTHIGGPTALLRYAGLALLTDPTFDPPGLHPIGERALTKITGPAVPIDALGTIDVVLLSHDQHPDNLDDTGRAMLGSVGTVLSTTAAAGRIPGVTGLDPWQEVQQPTAAGAVTITALPARHGGPGVEAMSGPVIGFLLAADGWPSIYISGDNASVALVEAIAERLSVDIAILFCGAARRPDMPEALTLTADDAVTAAKALGSSVVVPIHAEGWLHFTESPGTVATAFHRAGIADRLRIPLGGKQFELS